MQHKAEVYFLMPCTPALLPELNMFRMSASLRPCPQVAAVLGVVERLLAPIVLRLADGISTQSLTAANSGGNSTSAAFDE